MTGTNAGEVKKDADGSHSDLWEMLGALHLDVNQAWENLNEKDSQFNRRACVRSAFASIEAIIFYLKQDALRHGGEDVFTGAETALLLEESYTLHNGKAETQTKFLPLDQNFLFAVGMYSRGIQSPFVLEKGTEWEAFKKSIQVRNRITHPRSREVLEISQQEIEDVGTAYRWVVMSIVASLSESATALHAEVQRKLVEHGIAL